MHRYRPCHCVAPQWSDWGHYTAHGVSRWCAACGGIQFFRRRVAK
jgi:hypothetical protein